MVVLITALSSIAVIAIAAGYLMPWLAQRRDRSKPCNLLECDTHTDLGEYAKTDPRLILFDEMPPLDPGIPNLRALAVGPEDRIYIAGENTVVLLTPDWKRISGPDKTLSGSVHCLTAHDRDFFIGTQNHVEVMKDHSLGLIAWETLGKNAYITSIAVTDNDVFVADAGNRIILRYDHDGKLLNRIGAKDTKRGIPGFILPSAYFDVAAGPDGSVWAANTGRHSLENYRPNGDLISSWGDASPDIAGFCGCCNPSHFAILPDGRFVTAEKGFARVKIYDPAGKFLGVVAGPEKFARGTVGLDIAVDSTRRILVLDPKRGKIRVFVEKQPNAGEKP